MFGIQWTVCQLPVDMTFLLQSAVICKAKLLKINLLSEIGSIDLNENIVRQEVLPSCSLKI